MLVWKEVDERIEAFVHMNLADVMSRHDSSESDGISEMMPMESHMSSPSFRFKEPANPNKNNDSDKS